MLEALEEKFSKYEVARILGARALQISMNAPLLLKISKEELEEIDFNPLRIAERELMAEVLPITINRPMPKRRDEKIKTLTKEQIDEIKRKEAELKAIEEAKAEKEAEEATNKEAPLQAGEAKEDEQLVSEEETEEKKITEEGEIMELANPEDEASDIEGGSESEEI